MKQIKNLNEISQDLTLIDFYATWCGPCRMLTPILEQVDFVDVVKVDVDEARELAMQFKISVVPTLVLFKNNV